jgi:tetratricopeptide (TPR) repeat protein
MNDIQDVTLFVAQESLQGSLDDIFNSRNKVGSVLGGLAGYLVTDLVVASVVNVFPPLGLLGLLEGGMKRKMRKIGSELGSVVEESIKNAFVDKDPFANLLEKVTKSFDKQNFDQAIQYLNQYLNDLDIGTYAGKVYFLRGVSYFHLKEIDLCLKDYKKAIALDPELLDVYEARSLVYLNQLEYSSALDDLNQYILRSQDNKNVYLLRSKAHLGLKNYDQSLQDCNYVIKLDQKYAEAYFIKGFIFIKHENYQQAVVNLSRCIELGFKTNDVYKERYYCLIQLENYDSALLDAIVLTDRNPKELEFYSMQLICLKKLKRYEEAIETVSKLIDLDPNKTNQIEYKLERGYFLMKCKKYQQAVEEYTSIIQSQYNGDLYLAYFCRGCAFRYLQKFEFAISDLQKSINLKGDHGPSYLVLSQIYARQGMARRAFKLVKQAERNIGIFGKFVHQSKLKASLKLARTNARKQFIKNLKDTTLIVAFLIPFSYGASLLYRHTEAMYIASEAIQRETEEKIAQQAAETREKEKQAEQNRLAEITAKGEAIINKAENEYNYNFEVNDEFLLFPLTEWKQMTKFEREDLILYAQEIHGVSRIAYRELNGQIVLIYRGPDL